MEKNEEEAIPIVFAWKNFEEENFFIEPLPRQKGVRRLISKLNKPMQKKVRNK